MANFKILLALAFILCLGKSVAENDMPPQPSIMSTEPSNNTTTPPSNSTTAAPTTKPTTKHTTTITTPVPTSSPTTPPPKTTTTTTAPTTSPTTPSPIPTNSTTVAPITTPAPIPEPTTGNWLVNYTNSNQSCIVVDAAVQIEILKVNATSKKVNLPAKALSTGKCDDAADVLNLKWDTNVLTFNFVKDVNASSFELKSLELKLNLTDEPKVFTLVHEKPEFSTLLQHSYKCAKVQTLNLTEENKNDTIAYLHISHVQFQAFSNVTGHSFLEAIDCDASTITSDVVPIVVGCVLALLVVVVLVAYLVGRRRCQARGYLSIVEEDEDAP